jgi:two-component system response regulator VicR
VSSAFNGQEALDLLQEDQVDLILLDIIMPVMDGAEFLRRLHGKTKKVPVIVFSNLDSESKISEVYQLGATHYMLKAWASPKELVKIVKRSLSSKHN